MVYAIAKDMYSTSVVSLEEITVNSVLNGEKLAELRRLRGLGQRQLAEIAKVDASVISRLERNLQTDCMVSILMAISSVLGVTTDELLRNSQQTSNQSLVPELQAVNNTLSRQPEKTQRQAAGILRGYLSTLSEDL